jgi:CBS domain-containing protein
MTVSFDDSIGTPPLAKAIDRHPLTAAPDTCLLDVVKLMHNTAERGHQPLGNLQPQPVDSLWGARSSCVLVMQDEKLLGIFIERDLVQFTASRIDLRATKICDVMHHPVLTISEQSLHNVFAAIFLFRRHRIRHLAVLADLQQFQNLLC